MMKTTIKITIARLALTTLSICFASSLLLVSCSKDDPAPTPTPTPLAVAPVQNPLAGYLTATGFNQKTVNNINVGSYEFGYSFIPLVNGKMTAIVAKIPDVQMGLRVTVWNKTTGAILRTESIDIPTAGVEVTKAMTALDLVKDTEYFLTFNSNDWYDRRRTDGTSVTYPVTVGDIKITSYSYHAGTTQTLPNSVQTTYYAGDCSFKFQK